MGWASLGLGAALVGAGPAVVGVTFVDSSVSGPGLRSTNGMIASITAAATTANSATKPFLVRYHGGGTGLERQRADRGAGFAVDERPRIGERLPDLLGIAKSVVVWLLLRRVIGVNDRNGLGDRVVVAIAVVAVVEVGLRLIEVPPPEELRARP